MPVPVRVMVVGELLASLVTVTLAFGTAPVAAGAKVTVNVALVPGAIFCPVVTPLGVNPAPATLTLVTLTVVDDELFDRVTESALLVFTVTLPKARLVAFAFSVPVLAALTVSVALLLVTLPVELLTVTEKLSPEFPVTVAAVVYEVAVAPLMAEPFIFHW
jgi:hypothetical protein